jgi:hypothetical protein
MNPCGKCGSRDVTVTMERELQSGLASQYMAAYCTCGHKGSPSRYFKDCGMEGMSDEQIAIMNWNEENP